MKLEKEVITQENVKEIKNEYWNIESIINESDDNNPDNSSNNELDDNNSDNSNNNREIEPNDQRENSEIESIDVQVTMFKVMRET